MTNPPFAETLQARPKHWGVWFLCGAILATLAAGSAYWWIHHPAADTPEPQPIPFEPISLQGSGPAWFRAMTAESGLQFTYRNGEEADHFTILETLGGGVALIDYDGDGLYDLFVTGGGYFDGPQKNDIKGHPCKLFKNLGNWKFKDVTQEVGLEGVSWWYTHGAAVADYDRDGWPDLLVTGFGRMTLFHNESDGHGGRRFVDVTEKMGLHNKSWSTSAGFADLDGDGYPDLYVCHYVDWSFQNHPFCKGLALGVKQDTCGPERFKPLMHALFRNEKGKSFRNVSADHNFKAEGCGLGVILADLNDDGRPDIYVANDTNRNFLFVNRAGKLEEIGLIAGVAGDETGRPDGSMGVDAADYNGSGRASLWVTNFYAQVHGLYENRGRERFNHQSRAAGTAAIGQTWVGFGTGFVDVDNDGWEDLVIANGHVWRYPSSGSPKQKPVFLHNTLSRGQRFFMEQSRQGGPYFDMPAIGRGLSIGDLDNDGWPDFVVSHTNSPVALLRNEAAKAMPKLHNWMGVKLVGRDHRDIVGSTVRIEGTLQNLTRFAKGGGSYLSANDPRILFGLGSANEVRRVTVKWSWGGEQHWDNLEPNRYWILREGEATAERMPGHKRNQ